MKNRRLYRAVMQLTDAKCQPIFVQARNRLGARKLFKNEYSNAFVRFIDQPKRMRGALVRKKFVKRKNRNCRSKPCR